MMDAKKFFMVCYAFPPVGGAGVQRSVKFVKYVGQHGWKPTVLTVLNPSVPVVDRDLPRDIPADVEVLRARTLEPSYRVKTSLIPSQASSPSRFKSFIRKWAMRWLQPDAQVLWNPFAYRLACMGLKGGQFSAIYVSGPPFSSFLLGCQLKKQFQIPLVLDFRDEWSLSSQYLENRSHKNSVVVKQMRMFESTLRQADAIIATTHASADELTRCCKRIGSQALVRCIYNGFDPDDLVALERCGERTENYRLVYTGTLWRLTDITPMVAAVQKLAERFPLEAKRLELHFVGRRTAEQDTALSQLSTTPVVLHLHDYRSHRQALQFAFNADGLLLTLADAPGAERVVPGKLFEYLSLRTPILSLVPSGETARLLSEHSLPYFHPSDTDAIVDWLCHAIRGKAVASESPSAEGSFLELDWCNRATQAGQLASLLNEV